jgi:hypothetical protein
MNKETTFEAALTESIRETIRDLVAQGTCGMSLNNLYQVTPSPKDGGALLGTNAAFYYRQTFEKIVKENKDIAAFVIEDTDATIQFD